MSLGERLKEERTRLGFSQTEFAELVGASKRSQIGWEQGRSSPGAEALAVWASSGLDVLYVVTGSRSAPVAPALSRKEAALVDNYRHCAQEDQQAIERVALNAAKTQPDLLTGARNAKKVS